MISERRANSSRSQEQRGVLESRNRDEKVYSREYETSSHIYHDRQDRIAECLDELKNLMTYNLGLEGHSGSKLEKADILEVTVQYLRKLKQTDCLALTPNLTYSTRFRQGFNSCTTQVASFLQQSDSGVHPHAAMSILTQMSSNMQSMEHLAQAQQNQLKQIKIEEETIRVQPTLISTCPSRSPIASSPIASQCSSEMNRSAYPPASPAPLDLSCSTGPSWRPW